MVDINAMIFFIGLVIIDDKDKDQGCFISANIY